MSCGHRLHVRNSHQSLTKPALGFVHRLCKQPAHSWAWLRRKRIMGKQPGIISDRSFPLSQKKKKVMESLWKENDSFRITSGFVSLSGCKEQKEELLRMRLQRMPGFSAQHGPYFSFHSLHAWTVRNFPFLESIRAKVHQAVVLPGRQGESPPAEHRCRQWGNLSIFTGRHLLSLTNWTSRSWYRCPPFVYKILSI